MLQHTSCEELRTRHVRPHTETKDPVVPKGGRVLKGLDWDKDLNTWRSWRQSVRRSHRFRMFVCPYFQLHIGTAARASCQQRGLALYAPYRSCARRHRGERNAPGRRVREATLIHSMIDAYNLQQQSLKMSSYAD